ncbi:MAG: site-specific integrase, partial [Marinifilum sp.]|nr:site-specific integrase [Marinifilum sp.]
MKIKLRHKTIANGTKRSLYLDYYHKGVRKYEYLNIYMLIAPYNIPDVISENKQLKKKYIERIERRNAENWDKADQILTMRKADYLRGESRFDNSIYQNLNFISFYQQLCKKRINSSNNYGNWKAAEKHLINYAGSELTMKQISVKWLRGLQDYLKNSARKKNRKNLSVNSQESYYSKIKCAIKEAYRDGYLKEDITAKVEGMKTEDTYREFLSLDELKKLKDTPCKLPILKMGFLFASATGLRFCDVQNLKWLNVQHSKEMGHFLRYQQLKTGVKETLPISISAINLMGERKAPNDFVFPNLNYSDSNNKILQAWINKAG